MNRQFSARIIAAQYILILICAAILIYGIWYGKVLYMLVFGFLLLRVIEKIIHTHYTITAENELIIDHGRFYKTRIIPLQDINEVTYAAYLTIGGRRIGKYVMIVYNHKKYKLSLFPVNEKEFVKYLMKQIEQYHQHPKSASKSIEIKEDGAYICQKGATPQKLEIDTTLFPLINTYNDKEAYYWSFIYLTQYQGHCILDLLEEYIGFIPGEYPLSIEDIQEFDKEVVRSNSTTPQLFDKVYHYMLKAKSYSQRKEEECNS